MVYDLPADQMRAMVDAKVDSQFARAMRYVETIDAAAVVPSAGPPAFLDPDLFGFNIITGDEPSIFPDQRSFMARLDAAGHLGILAVPGTEIEIHHGQAPVVRHPMPDAEVQAIFDDKADYLRRYQADWLPYIQQHKDAWARPTADLLSTLQAWWEPILRMAPTVCAAVGGPVVIHATSADPSEQLSVVIDFPNAQVREFAGEDHGFWFRIDRRLVETVVAHRAVDWSNALFLSCRFQAWRAGPFNEYVYNFFKSLSVERMRLTEAEALRKLDPDRGGLADQELEIGNYMVQRTCPHRGADLAVFGEVDGCILTCTLHGWKFDLDTGRCLTADDRMLRVRRRND
jgi:UDP-MurNAc hydroxylase